jgi:GMC oxidoreductase/FAD dependent oxidoreductase
MILDDGGRGILAMADVCIIGAGPVGIAVALECERRGLSVTLLESGSDGFDADAQALSTMEIVDPRHHASSDLAVRRALGGTSLIWCGRCVPYDDIDFESREHVPESGWPIAHQDVAAYYAIATRQLDCGKPVFRALADSGSGLSEEVRLDSLERWCRQINSRRVHSQRLTASADLRIHLRCTAIDLQFADDGQRLEGVVVASGDARRLVTAHHYVLAGGGIECARLLLHAQTAWPRKFGGVDGPLGRFYQGHIFGRIADIVFSDRSVGGSFDYFQDEHGFYTRRRMTIDGEMQRRHRLLNIAFLPDNPWFYDHRHGSGILSLLYLLLAYEPIGRRLVPEAIRLQQIGPEPRRYLPHLTNILADLPGTAFPAMELVRHRFLQSTRKPAFVDNRKTRYPLYYHGEHAPNANSRVRLSSARDALGLPRVVVDLRFAGIDAKSVIESHALLDAWLRRKAIGRLEYFDRPEERGARILKQACDGYHQIGLTRMSSSPRQGIVDVNCKVHDVDNLFVAGSSVFPTSGQANPTLLAAAMAARLAEHLEARRNRHSAYPVDSAAYNIL